MGKLFVCVSLFAMVLGLCACGDAEVGKSGEASGGVVADFDQYDEAYLSNYLGWAKKTEEPHTVSYSVYKMCAMVQDADEKEKADIAKYGPHHDTRVDIYLNSLAEEGFPHEGEWPVGSVIVKKKHHEYRAYQEDATLAFGGMIKREKGYDPENGDWEYFYRDLKAKDQKSAVLARGKMQNCINCHKGAADRDYVFGTWSGKN